MNSRWNKEVFYRTAAGLILTTVALFALAGALWVKGYTFFYSSFVVLSHAVQKGLPDHGTWWWYLSRKGDINE